jgi:hypothetical protein
MADLKFTPYFERRALKRPYVTRALCIATVLEPSKAIEQPDGRWRFWRSFDELGGRYLRVVTLADRVTVLNAFLDRGFRP